MTATLSMKQSSLEMMQFSNVQFQALFLTLSRLNLGLILRPITSVLIFWVKIVHGIFYRVVNSIKDTDRVSNDDKDDLFSFESEIRD